MTDAVIKEKGKLSRKGLKFISENGIIYSLSRALFRANWRLI